MVFDWRFLNFHECMSERGVNWKVANVVQQNWQQLTDYIDCLSAEERRWIIRITEPFTENIGVVVVQNQKQQNRFSHLIKLSFHHLSYFMYFISVAVIKFSAQLIVIEVYMKSQFVLFWSMLLSVRKAFYSNLKNSKCLILKSDIVVNKNFEIWLILP